MNGILLWLARLVLLANFPTEDALKATVDGSPMTTTNEAIDFYTNWDKYLHLNLGWFHSITGWLENGIFKALFALNQGAQDVFDKSFDLLGWEGTLSQSGSPLHGLYVFFNIVGWALMAFGLVIIAFQSTGHSVKWGKILPNVFMVAITMTILPYLMRTVSSSTPTFGNIAQTAKQEVGQASSKEMSSDLAAQPFKNNIIDLSYEIRRDWKDDPDKTPVSKLNGISDARSIQNMDLGAYMDKDTIKDLQLEKNHKAATQVMYYHLIQEPDAGYILAKNHNGTGMGSGNDEVYARYSVNWIGILGESIMVCAMFVIASLKIVKDIFELSILNVVAPIQAYRAIRQPKVLRDLMNSMVGLYLSFVLMLATFKMAMTFVSIAPTIVHFDNMVKQSIFTIIVYLGVIYGMLAGVAYFEKMTGVTQGHSDEVGHALAAGATGVALAGLATKGLGSAFGGKKDGSNSGSGSGGTGASATGSGNGGQGIYGTNGDNSTDSSNSQDQTKDQTKNQDNNQNNTSNTEQDQKNNAESSSQENNNVEENNTNSDGNSDQTGEEGHGIGETDDQIDSNAEENTGNQDGLEEGHGIGTDEDNGVDNNDINSSESSELSDTSANTPSEQGEGIGETDDTDIDSSVPGSTNEESGQGIGETDDQDNSLDQNNSGISGSSEEVSDNTTDNSSTYTEPTTDNTGNIEDYDYSEDTVNNGGNTSNKKDSTEDQRNIVEKTGDAMRKGSVEYLKNHRFNLANQGHLHGRESDRFDDE